ncbi:MAG: HRDC domain-containing protein [Candidatus Eremiobacteraeota bacterium]|nr:HRDC domain-containing protein [Candidatus Eremiobacteraeota bacterium]
MNLMHPQTIATSQELVALCERVRKAPRLGIDTEFHNERSYTARLMVVQIAFEDGAALVDPLAVPDLRPLAQALCETEVVGHALTSDLKIFADRFGIVPGRVFDCQVGAAFLGYGMSISLADLVRELTGVRLKKSHTVSDWSARPLSPGQIEYLIDDVAHLLEMQDRLVERLRANGRYAWAVEECATLSDLRKYQVDERRSYMRIPGSNRMSRRELGVLLELSSLRHRVARERDLPLKFVMPDDVVAGLATLRPKRPDDLAQLRRLDSGARRTLGPAVLEAVARGEAIPENELPEKTPRPLGSSRETLASLMSVVAGEIARDNELPTSLLVPRSALERVAREVPSSRDAFERTLDLSAWRMSLVADPIWRLLSGESALRIEGYAGGDPRITPE